MAGYSNTNGWGNVFSGVWAGNKNTTGNYNVFSGIWAGYSNTTGAGNVFLGYEAGDSNTTGSSNTFLGDQSGYSNTIGNNNTFLGVNSGYWNNSGSSNIYIGNQGPSPGSENNAIRIGDIQTAAYIAGIYGTNIGSGNAVYINSNGQLGTSMSSRRFKENIEDMGAASSKLFQLRPVTFFYKPQYDDGSHLLQYGLIAEEVAEVYPEMVAYDKDGQPYTVKYQYLAPMLLNELQKEHAIIASQQELIRTQQNEVTRLQNTVTSLQSTAALLQNRLQQEKQQLEQRLSRLEGAAAAQH